jgi:hypothetical protein
MKSYLIDEISAPDMERLSMLVRDRGSASGLDKVFWINIPDDHLNELQSSHAGCRPYVFAIELGSSFIKAEFFIRTLKDMGCPCSSYPDQEQGRFIIRFVDGMIEELGIRT